MRRGMILLLLALAACLAPADYRDDSPTLDPRAFFDGTLDAWGIVHNWRGRTTERFHMVMQARWAGDIGHFDEAFTFADGTTRQRHWTITRRDATHFTGTAPDVIGAAEGEVAGPALHWNYTIRLPKDGGGENVVAFDDWLFLIEPDTMFSEVAITKFGLPVGRMTMFFRQRP